MNNALYWLYLQHNVKALTGLYHCYLCGSSCEDSHAVKSSIPDTFNSHYLAKCPSSKWLCNACHWYLDGKIGHPDFRKMSLIVRSHTWRNWQRVDMKSDIKQMLVDGLPEESYLVVSLSKKKHILLQAPLNGERCKIIAIQVEEQVAYADLASWSGIEVPFMKLVSLGHGKGEILSGNLYSSTLRKHGQIDQAMYYSSQLSMWRNSPLITLYSYTTILEEKSVGDESDHGGDRDSISNPASDLDTDQFSVQNGATTNDLVTDGKQHGKHCEHEQHSTGIHQQALW